MEEDYEIILEGFIDKIHTDFGLRLDIENIFWRGFYSQGDGLCFDFKLENKEVLDFLIKLNYKNIEPFKEAIDSSFIRIEIETFKNNFATHYCHSNTRDININVWFEEDAELDNKHLFDLLSESFKDLQKEIKVWYVNICDEIYDELKKHYEEVQDLEEEQEDMTFSDKIDALIDPEMNIDKVIEMIQDAKSLSYTKSEAYSLIEKFRENFKKEYLIIKKIS